jgi:sugar lactone lactonase YvrE
MVDRIADSSFFLATSMAIGALLFTSCQIDPLPWYPPQKPAMIGPYEPNEDLEDAELFSGGLLNGPEDVAIDAQGRLYCGSADGLILRILSDGRVEVFAETGGYPLGLDFDPEGNLIVCEPSQGLLSIDPHGNVVILANEAEGLAFKTADDVDVASNGMIYFSDASWKFGLGETHLDMLEARPHGRLLCYNPDTEETEVLLGDLYFANGVALSQAEDFVLVNESYRYRITLYWLEGPNAGESEILVENLPGFPDGVSASGHGTFWVAFYSVRSDLLDSIHPCPGLKLYASLLPESQFHALAEPYGFVAGMDENGEVFVSYQDPGGNQIREVTSVEEFKGSLYLGSVHGDTIGRLTFQ